MRIFSEVIANDLLPVYRSLLAQELSKKGMNQEKIASIIRVTQPAVSQYLRGIRGSKSLQKDDSIMSLINSSARKASESPHNVYKSEEFRDFCKSVMNRKLLPDTEHIEDCASF